MYISVLVERKVIAWTNNSQVFSETNVAYLKPT